MLSKILRLAAFSAAYFFFCRVRICTKEQTVQHSILPQLLLVVPVP